MSVTARFLFDENIGRPVMEAVRAAVDSKSEFVHISELTGAGTSDEDWITMLGGDPSWVVLTADGGKKSPTGQKLPEMLRAVGIKFVLFSPKMHNLKMNDKQAILIAIWNEIEAVWASAKGSEFALQLTSRSKKSLEKRAKLVQVK